MPVSASFHNNRKRHLHPVRVALSAPALALCLTMLCAVGCRDGQHRWHHHNRQENYDLALNAVQPDERREAVVRIAESRYADSEEAFNVLDVVARTDNESQIRCIAVRGLARYDDDRPVATLLKIMQAGDNSEQALPPGEDLRWEVARTLLIMDEKGLLADDQRDLAADIFIDLLQGDSSRNVRIIAAEALGRFQQRKVFAPLIVALRDRDFAIADQAEQSLIALTGVTHHYDADAWEQWIASTDAPFADAGTIPEDARSSGPSWWDETQRRWRKALKLGEKEK